MRRLTMMTAAAATLVLLGGCGKGSKGLDATGNVTAAPTPRALAADEAPSGAMDYWGKKIDIVCPAAFPILPRAPGDPIDDIRGLRLGVSGETAIRFAQCKDGKPLDTIYQEDDAGFRRETRGLKIRTQATVTAGVFPNRWRSSGDIFDTAVSDRLQRTDAIWHFVMDGMPGHEKLYAMWLEQPFAAGSQPTVESQWAALKTKYGEPDYTDDNGRAYWLHLPDGKPIPAFNRDLIHRCANALAAGFQQFSYSEECGIIVSADIAKAENPLLARSVYVAALDAAGLYRYQANQFEAERDELLAGQAESQAHNAAGGSF